VAQEDVLDTLDRTLTIAREYIAARHDRPVWPTISLDDLRAALAGPLPGEPSDPSRVIEALASAADPGLVTTTGPRYFGFVTGGALPATVAAEWLTTAWDQNGALFVMSPAASVVEEVAGTWLLDLLGLPQTVSVGFVTGCGMANFTAMAAARHELLRRAGWDVESDGLHGAPRLRVIVGDEVHVSMTAALRLIGVGSRQLERVPVDDQGRMKPDALGRVLTGGGGPTIVCAQAGNVNTGAFDPLDAIAEITSRHRAWLHIDGAFGLWANASAALKHLVRGVERADSWATDAHKWLNVPYDSGLVFTAHPAAHRAAMSMDAKYLTRSSSSNAPGAPPPGARAAALEDSPPHSNAAAALGTPLPSRGPQALEPREPMDWTPEASRRARGFSIYAALRSLGRRGIEDLVDRCCRLARRFADRLRHEPSVRILNDVVLNQVLVRVEPPGADADAATRAVLKRVQEERICWMGGTRWHDMDAIRISVSNWSTTDEDVDRSVESIIRALRQA
jgi:glutamate/tyrosine decarboxylase-like PLP-dependent enzyme